MTVLRARLRAASLGALLMAALVTVPGTAQAAETVDQQQTGANSGVGAFGRVEPIFPEDPPAFERILAQTFTAGRTGGLTRVELVLAHSAGATHDLAVEIRGVQNSGAPSNTVLASTSVPANETNADINSGDPTSIAFDVPAHVVDGTTYAVVVRASVPTETFFYWGTDSFSTYAGGSSWLADAASPSAWTGGGAFDLWFQTFVDPAIVPAVPPSGPSFDPACSATGAKAGFHVIKGTDGNDVLNGTAGRDLIYGFGGNDVIQGRGGNDLICAGSGNDLVVGGNGKDVVFGGAGDDRLRGGSGNDRLFGGDGNDLLIGRNGRDVLRGDAGNDSLRGGNGSDHLFGNAGDDKLRGGNGVDLVDGGPGTNDIQ